MSIKETLEKIKPFYNLLVIIVVSSIFFALGRLSYQNKAIDSHNSISIVNVKDPQVAQVLESVNLNTYNASQNTLANGTENQVSKAEVIGSKSGKKYYFPWCGTVKRIKPENQVKFDSIEDAKKAGFAPGGNCKGLY